MAIAPNVAAAQVRVPIAEQPTMVIPRIRPTSFGKPLVLIMIPTLVLAVVVGILVGPTRAPLLGAAIGVIGAAVAMSMAIRKADTPRAKP
jgi:hypothetical protein